MSTIDVDNVGKPNRDYSLVGESTKREIETGLASAEWNRELPATARPYRDELHNMTVLAAAAE